MIGKTALVGEIAVTCSLQSATAGMNSDPRFCNVPQPVGKGADKPVSRNANLRTMSGGEPSSIKEDLACAVRLPALSRILQKRAYRNYQRSVCGLAGHRQDI